ncbi:MAG: oligosaccharide flippase family protein [Planctomycetota bacterium]|nr:oligosaccharide flippase family protein [Planctomycetota bacterium]
MTTRGKVYDGAAKLAIGQVAGQGLSFVRNVIVARYVTPADFGVAALLALSVSLMEMISDLNLSTLLIQSRQGDTPGFQRTLHCVGAIRGVVNSLALFALAWPLSVLLGVPEARWAFQWLSAYPLVKGLTHSDPTRRQRDFRFGPSVLVELGSQLVAVLVAWPLAASLRGYSAFIWIMLIQISVSWLLSHLLAERHYRWAWDRDHVKHVLSFSWPLLLNGVLLFLIQQGDCALLGMAPRLFPGAPYSMADVGLYSIALSLSVVPITAVAKVNSSLLLPGLSQVQSSVVDFNRRYRLGLETLALAGGICGLLFLAAGGTIVVLVYGEKYAGAATVVGWLGAAQAIRLARIAPTTGALAKGDSMNPLIANVVRVLGLVLGVAVVAKGGPLSWIAGAACCGEGAALAIAVLRFQRINSVPFAVSAPGLVWLAGGLALGTVLHVAILARTGAALTLAISAMAALSFAAVAVLSLGGIRREAWLFLLRLLEGRVSSKQAIESGSQSPRLAADQK